MADVLTRLIFCWN